MKYFIFRNTTIEPLFKSINCLFSGYDDISIQDIDANTFIWFYVVPYKQNYDLLIDEIDSYYNNLQFVINQIPLSTPFYIFTLNLLHINRIITGDLRIKEAICEFNRKIKLLETKYKNIRVIDIDDFFSKYPVNHIVDWKYYYISKMLMNPKLAKEFQRWFNDQLNAINMIRKKCIILDLDNTLWGGVLGEEGVTGIKIGGDYPGNAFYDFQASLLELNKAGILLAVCSKNNESDVLEAWEQNPNILIKKEHLATYRINWNNKAENINEMIKELNIGADSVVFIDDNPSERELVKQFIPSIEVPEFPNHPYELPEFVVNITNKYFRIYNLTEEDKLKTQQYKKNAERAAFEKNFNDFSEYLKSLQIVIEVNKASPLTIPRIAQMTQKTNQFNLTTKRYTEADIVKLLEKDYLIYTLKVSDRFGDSGITGLIIIETNNVSKIAHIDSFLLSCRILGKNIEHAFLNIVLEKIFKNGFAKVTSEYIKTRKNSQVADFYDKMGFVLEQNSTESKEIKYYFLSKVKYKSADYKLFKIIDNDE